MLVSPDIQLDAIQANCRLINKRIVAVVPDINESGRTFQKRRVGEMIEGIRLGVAKSITIYKWSRWGRNLEQSLAYLGLVNKAGGRVDSATDDSDQKTAQGRLSRDLIMRFDEFQSDMIGESWRAAQQRRREAGLPHSGRKRFGYDYVKATRESPARFVINPGEAEACAYCYKEYCAGRSIRNLMRWMNDQGWRTAFGGRWQAESLTAMLDTGFAAGLIRERSEEQLAAQQAKPARNSLKAFDVWRTGAHDPIIDMDTWTEYRRRRGAMAALPNRAGASPVHELSAMLLCGVCAHRLRTKYSGKTRTHQWVCQARSALHPGTGMSISNAVVLRALRAWIVAQMGPAPSSVDEDARVELAAAQPAARVLADVNEDIRRWLRRIDRLVDMSTDEDKNGKPLIDRPTFLNRMSKYEEAIAALRAELQALESTPALGAVPYQNFALVDAAWDAATPEERHWLVADLVGFVIVSPASGRGPRADAAERLEIVGSWDVASKERWLSARRRRPLA